MSGHEPTGHDDRVEAAEDAIRREVTSGSLAPEVAGHLGAISAALAAAALAAADAVARPAAPTTDDKPAAWLIAHQDVPRNVEVTMNADRVAACRRAGVYVITDLVRAPGAVAAAPPGNELTARLLDAFTRGDHDRHDSLYMEVLRALKAGARIVGAPVDPATRFRPGDFVTVADAATVGEYVGYEGGPFHRHRYRVVWPDGTRTPGVSAADDLRVNSADPAVLAGYAITLTKETP